MHPLLPARLRNALAGLLLEAVGERSGPADPPAAAAAIVLLQAYGDLASTPAGPVPVQALLARARAIAPHGAGDLERGLARLCSAYFERHIVEAEDTVRLRRAIGSHAPRVHAQVSAYVAALVRAAARPPLPQEPVLRGIATAALLFNVGLYFEVHEVLEVIWRESAGDLKTVVQGLLQTAVALHHADAGNLRSAWTSLCKGTDKLRRTSNPVPSIDVAALLAALAPWEQHLARVAGGDGTRADAGAPNGALPARPRLRLPPYEL
jgi:hypothetical protein